MSRRTERINVLLRQEISELLARQVRDPRLSGLISITRVETAPDLSVARVYVSVLGDAATKQAALAGIESATAFLRRELRPRLALRQIPQLKFVLDESIEQADRLSHVLDKLKEVPPAQPSAAPSASYQGPLSIPFAGG